MIVDDSPRDLRAVEVTLMSAADVVARASSGEEALKLAADTPADAAIIDYKMPGMDGIELAGRLKSDHPDMKIILLTAVDDVEAKASASPHVDHFHHKIFVDTLRDALVAVVSGETDSSGAGGGADKPARSGLFRRRGR